MPTDGRSAPQQPEIFLYNDTPYKLPEPESTDLMVPAASPLGQPSPQQQVESRSPREWLLFVVWRQKFLMLAVLVLALVAGFVYLQVKTPIYASTARLYVQPSAVSFGGGGQAGYGPNGGSNFLYTQRERITSEPVLAIAASKLKAMEDERRKQGEAFEVRTLKGVTKPAEHLKEIVLTDLDKNNDIISVTAHSPYSDEAALIANTVVSAFKTSLFQPKVNTTGQTVQALEKLKKEAEAELKAKTDIITAMEAQHGPLQEGPDERTNIVKQRLIGLSDALLAAQKETINARSAYEELKRSMGVTDDNLKLSPSELDSDLLLSSEQDQALLRSLILQAQSQLEELRQRYLPNHPAVVAMKQKLAQYNLAYLASIQRRFVSAQRKEEEYQRSYNEGLKAANEINAQVSEFGRHLEDIARLKKQRDGYEANIKSIQLENEAGKVNVEEIEAAQAQAKPSLPSRTRTLAVSLALGLVAGLMLACMREWIDDRFRSAGEIKSSLGMPLLAVIPQSATKRSLSVSGQRILLDPSSDAAEAYRSLRTAIQFATPSGDMKTLLVTSPMSGDGKTTLVSNLAIAMAQSGKKVIVVDADLRKPMQHEIFGAKNNTGLSMLLAGRCSLDTAVQRTGVTGLDILPCGPAPANPTEILNSREFGDTLEQLADKYDCVVIDSSPVESVNDARIISATCDATLIVLKAQTAHRRQAERARDSLLGVGARIIGLVVNDLPRRTAAGYGQFAQTRRYVPGLTSQEYDILQARSK